MTSETFTFGDAPARLPQAPPGADEVALADGVTVAIEVAVVDGVVDGVATNVLPSVGEPSAATQEGELGPNQRRAPATG